MPTEGEWAQIGVRADQEDGTAALVGDVAIGSVAGQPDTYELGVTIAPAHQGRGYAREALALVTDWLFDTAGAHRVFVQADARNTPMIAVARALGWRHEGSMVEGDWFKSEWTTLERFAVLRREWLAARAGG